MLRLCVEHGITATIEHVSAIELGAAYQRVVASGVRYRAVLDIGATLPDLVE
jgi:uncharacterized zinc-type alcohol dehydrogenase-like protein